MAPINITEKTVEIFVDGTKVDDFTQRANSSQYDISFGSSSSSSTISRTENWNTRGRDQSSANFTIMYIPNPGFEMEMLLKLTMKNLDDIPPTIIIKDGSNNVGLVNFSDDPYDSQPYIDETVDLGTMSFSNDLKVIADQGGDEHDGARIKAEYTLEYKVGADPSSASVIQN